jgi:hypothetical protein
MPALKLLRFDTTLASEQPAGTPKSRTSEIQREYIPGYPQTLFIYRLPASQYWWVRFYIGGKTLRKTSKQNGRREAAEFAKQFYEQVTTNYRLGLVVAAPDNFRAQAKAVLAQELAKLNRGDITKITYDNFVYRFNKSVLPYFGHWTVHEVDYIRLDQYVTHLSRTGVSAVTIRSYLQLVRKVLSQASRYGLIQSVPEFPKIRVKHKARGWFTPAEYLKLWRSARKLSGQTWEIRKYRDAQGNKQTQYVSKDAGNKTGEHMRYVRMTVDMVRLIEFMVNGYIRPTDIKNMRHQHIDIIKGDYLYLRLRLPESKGHTDPITTMPQAVRAYRKLREYHAEQNGSGQVSPGDYVFVPGQQSRNHALQLLQHQFEVILAVTGLRSGVNGELRSLYSLRHSSIMYRMLYGAGINTLILARNARTSVDMIDRFYAKPLSGEMNIGMLQSRRKRLGQSR